MPARNKHWPIPDEIDVGSHLIHVRLVTKRQMREELDDNDPLPFEEVRGLWDPDQDTIFIGKWLPKKTQRRVLLHELIHACIDYRDLYD